MSEPAADRPAVRDQLGQQVLNAMLRSKCQPNSGNLAVEIADALLPVVERIARGRAGRRCSTRLVIGGSLAVRIAPWTCGCATAPSSSRDDLLTPGLWAVAA